MGHLYTRLIYEVMKTRHKLKKLLKNQRFQINKPSEM
jgi:hypothetical protein